MLSTYTASTPAARLRIIRRQLAWAASEPGTLRLITTVSAVEALARSLVVHASGRPSNTAQMRYRQFRHSGPVELVEEVLRLRGAAPAARHFPGETWPLFELASDCRDAVVHECAQLAPDRTAAAVQAAQAVFEGLIELAGLPRAVV
ncbi:Hypothetical protein Rta_06560 [Ramlibacter tataouinensis TTB310]|uniref:Uncharacterized protein n=1 Tax=Ramlibacter tataouinensis (strain ATCC BAA-407 / DSM 14655 / LMG 21543 / TTB310) TaxID=365046 RepID=F5XWX3_RAMTT|nr:Hypothetical protein Rta_06560 [Ramlibacter tataouinensis TTB310]